MSSGTFVPENVPTAAMPPLSSDKDCGREVWYPFIRSEAVEHILIRSEAAKHNPIRSEAGEQQHIQLECR
jgi:hypothetical protein